MEDIRLADFGVSSYPMEAPTKNADHGSDKGKQKDVTEFAAKDHSNQGIQKDDMEAPVKNLDEDFAIRIVTKLLNNHFHFRNNM